MQVFILGGTGSIGTAIVQELVARSHKVIALSRSKTSDDILASHGAAPLRGDMQVPCSWINSAMECDAIIQVAATFGDDMAEVDNAFTTAIIKASLTAPKVPRLIYTGGCWLYGETKNRVATEEFTFDPLPAFSWMVDHGERLLACPNLSAAILHPAMVYHAQGGVFERFLDAARAGEALEIWGGMKARWPLIEREDLARAYCDLLVRPDLTGHFNAASEEGVHVADIVQTFAQTYGILKNTRILDVDTLVETHGAWAKGPTLDQQMSGAKLQSALGWVPLVPDYKSSGIFTV